MQSAMLTSLTICLGPGPDKVRINITFLMVNMGVNPGEIENIQRKINI